VVEVAHLEVQQLLHQREAHVLGEPLAHDGEGVQGGHLEDHRDAAEADEGDGPEEALRSDLVRVCRRERGHSAHHQ